MAFMLSKRQMVLLSVQAANGMCELVENKGECEQFYLHALEGVNHKYKIDQAFREFNEGRKRPWITWKLIIGKRGD